MNFAERYGPWALVAGASEGLGAAFATELAGRGLNLILIARRPEPLAALAASLPTRTVTVVADLATDEGIATAVGAGDGLEVGLVVANAAYSPIGAFLDLEPAQARRALQVNCAAPVELAHRYLPPMRTRRRGGLVIMSSLAGQQGSPPITVYAATKAFGAVLADGLWAELRPHGVHVVACVAGAVATPGLSASLPAERPTSREDLRPAGLAGSKTNRAPGTLEPAQVVAAALRGLGRGPRVVPGVAMRISSVLMSRLLPHRTAIAIISRASRDLAPPT